LPSKRKNTITLDWPDSIPQDQISKKFIQGMLDRMAFGFHNYGHIKINFDNPGKHIALKNLDIRYKMYKETGNTEWLMDLANYAMIEFKYPRHPKAHFRSTSKEESPGSAMDGDREGMPRVRGKEEDPVHGESKRITKLMNRY